MINIWDEGKCLSVYMRDVAQIEIGENGRLAVCMRDGSTIYADEVTF